LLGEPSKTMQSTARRIRHFALKRLTDTQVACRLDWQGLIIYKL